MQVSIQAILLTCYFLRLRYSNPRERLLGTKISQQLCYVRAPIFSSQGMSGTSNLSQRVFISVFRFFTLVLALLLVLRIASLVPTTHRKCVGALKMQNMSVSARLKYRKENLLLKTGFTCQVCLLHVSASNIVMSNDAGALSLTEGQVLLSVKQCTSERTPHGVLMVSIMVSEVLHAPTQPWECGTTVVPLQKTGRELPSSNSE